MGKSYDIIFENNRKWVEAKITENPDFFKILAETQNPEYLYIGCSDSRVSAEEMMGMKPGEVFVTRNVANLVNTLDMNSTAVIQYAVEHLKVKHIIVCGHYGCGGVEAALGNKQFGIIDNWLRNIKDTYRLHYHELDMISDPVKRRDRLVELNVIEGVFNLSKTSIVQNRWANGKKLGIHGWVYSLETGLIKDLSVSCQSNDHLGSVFKMEGLTIQS